MWCEKVWQTVTTQAMAVLSARSKGATPVEHMQAERIVAVTAKRWNRTAKDVCRLIETGGPGGTPMEPDEALDLLRAMADEQRQQPDYPTERRKWLAQVHHTDRDTAPEEARTMPASIGATPAAAFEERPANHADRSPPSPKEAREGSPQ